MSYRTHTVSFTKFGVQYWISKQAGKTTRDINDAARFSESHAIEYRDMLAKSGMKNASADD